MPMRNRFSLLLCLFVMYSTQNMAQAPQGIPYQAIVRDANGNLLNNQSVSLRISIRDASTVGTILYKETHAVVTTAIGLIAVNIGSGSPVIGTFASINWATNAKFMQVEMDVAGGSNYTDMGTQQMMSVPYALYAEKANVPNGTIAGQVLIWNGTQWAAGSVCSLFNSDLNNCGSCNNVCPPNPVNGTYACVNGVCTLTCNSGLVNCNGSCRNLTTDLSNCGSCGNSCTNANGTTACFQGLCTPVCNTGYANCDGNPNNGCETNKQTNVNNCGNCGVVCPARPNATTTCVNGVCSFTCNSGFKDCNGLVADGCELNVLFDNSNCGACGNVCPGSRSCVNGTCQ